MGYIYSFKVLPCHSRAGGNLEVKLENLWIPAGVYPSVDGDRNDIMY